MNLIFISKQKGFTLIEMVISIIILGIAGLMAGQALQLGFQSYGNSSDRQDNQMQAKFVIDKLNRELRYAVPNSIELSSGGQCLTFVMLEASAFYLNLPTINETSIDTVILSEEPSNLDDLRLVINPSTLTDLSAGSRRSVAIDNITVSAGVSTIGFSDNHNPAFISSSMADRAFIYNVNNQVEYCIRTTQSGLFRTGIQIADHIMAGQFLFDGASMSRNATVKVRLTFSNDLGEATEYQHDIQVINVP